MKGRNDENVPTAKLFGTNGIRAKLDVLNPDLALCASKGFATYVNCGKILVCRDMRLTGEMLESAVISGLISSGAAVIKLGITPAPTAQLAIKKLSANGCINITASHNPPEWNALKFYDSKTVSISRERGAQIEAIMNSGKFKSADWSSIGKISSYENACSDHARAILNFINLVKIKKAKKKVIIDYGNGTGSLVMPLVFAQFGWETIPLNSQLDGTFPGRPSEPTEANLSTLISQVKSQRADLGIAFDGDADRVIFIDEKGTFIFGDKTFALCVKNKLAQTGAKGGSVVTTVATSRAVEDIAKENGAKMVYTKVGEPYLAEAMASSSITIGGEEVGGVIWPELHLGKDGLSTAAKICEHVSEAPLSSLIAQLPQYYNSKTKIECAPKQKAEIIAKISDAAKKEKGAKKVTTIDGIRVDFADSWVIIRASGTENYVRVFAEAKSEKEAKELTDFWKEKCTQLL
ncbi:Phosphoglucomutase/phosphomannomutase [Candidatus Gugararchaeum adminiculabundum]|nr:Phosphoglucomutase/phosphomannomutase [Candidatus Gugararchaeum adminiculabundum]